MSWKRWLWMGLGVGALAAMGAGCTGNRKGLQGRDDPMWGGGSWNTSNQMQTGQPEMGSVQRR